MKKAEKAEKAAVMPIATPVVTLAAPIELSDVEWLAAARATSGKVGEATVSAARTAVPAGEHTGASVLGVTWALTKTEVFMRRGGVPWKAIALAALRRIGDDAGAVEDAIREGLIGGEDAGDDVAELIKALTTTGPAVATARVDGIVTIRKM